MFYYIKTRIKLTGEYSEDGEDMVAVDVVEKEMFFLNLDSIEYNSGKTIYETIFKDKKICSITKYDDVLKKYEIEKDSMLSYRDIVELTKELNKEFQNKINEEL